MCHVEYKLKVKRGFFFVLYAQNKNAIKNFASEIIDFGKLHILSMATIHVFHPIQFWLIQWKELMNKSIEMYKVTHTTITR